MDSENACIVSSKQVYNYKVPVVNLDDQETVLSISNPKKLTNRTDHDDSTIDGSNSKQNRTKHSCSISNNCRKADPIVIDEDSDKDDCTIINSLESETIHKNSQKSCEVISKITHYSSYYNKKHINIITTVHETSQESTSNVKLTKQPTNHVEVKNTNEEAIVIEEDSEKDNDCAIIDVIQSNVISTFKKVVKNAPRRYKNADVVAEICRQDKGLAELIEKCFEMENSEGMTRIVHRTVVPIYIDTSAEFKKSEHFQRFLTKTIIKLEKEPHIKFTHLKSLCEFMKEGKNFEGKKRVQLTTLKKSLNGQFSKRKIKSCNNITPVKKKKIDFINLDDISDDDTVTNVSMPINSTDEAIKESPFNGNATEIQIESMRSHSIENSSGHITSVDKNETESNSSQAMIIDKNRLIIKQEDNDLTDCENNNCDNIEAGEVEDVEKNDDIILIDEENDNSNKENITTISKNKETKINSVNEKTHNYYHRSDDISTKITEIDLCNDDDIDNVFKIHNTEQANGTDCSSIVAKTNEEEELKSKLESIETKIKMYNEFIRELESKEVDWNINGEDSPYVRSEHYKYLVVTLYKELCRLTGSEAIKRHRVRLKVVQGRPEGPVRCLEEYINSNIDENGNPPFPDMHDVIYCVEKANMECQLGWGKKEIEMEARALFIHYGRTVQKKRQKREWRHLMRYVESDDVADPADQDPALQARLQQNAALATKNEKELLDMYAAMENSNYPRVPENETGMSLQSSENSNYPRLPENETGMSLQSSENSNYPRVPENEMVISLQSSENSNYPRVPENEMGMSLQSSGNSQETIPLVISSVTSIAPENSQETIPLVISSVKSIAPENSQETIPLVISHVTSIANVDNRKDVPNVTPNNENLTHYIANNENEHNITRNAENIHYLANNESVPNLAPYAENIHSYVANNDNINTNVPNSRNIPGYVIVPCNGSDKSLPKMVSLLYNGNNDIITPNSKAIQNINEQTQIINIEASNLNKAFNDTVHNKVNIVNRTDNIKTNDKVNKPNNTKIRLNSYVEGCNGCITDNLVLFNPRVVLTPLILTPTVTYPVNVSVNQNISPTMNLTAQETNDLLNKRLEKCKLKVLINNTTDACSKTNPDKEKCKNSEENTKDDEESVEESETKPNLIALKILQLLNSDDTTNSDSDDDNGANMGQDDINSEDDEIINENSEISQDISSKSVQDPEVSTNSNSNNLNIASNNTANNLVHMNPEIIGDANCEVENDAGTSENSEVVVKREPLDIPSMLAGLGDNFTVSIIDIEDPFEVIEISDSSESEDDDV